jgi:hypothetical protein
LTPPVHVKRDLMTDLIGSRHYGHGPRRIIHGVAVFRYSVTHGSGQFATKIDRTSLNGKR